MGSEMFPLISTAGNDLNSSKQKHLFFVWELVPGWVRCMAVPYAVLNKKYAERVWVAL